MNAPEPDRPADELRIDVDVQRALEVLSGNVFAGPKACLRELIANAADGISRLPPEAQGNVEIRLQAADTGDRLTISDNGIGMSRTEAGHRLGTIFSSGSVSRRDAIGRFGIGFYSCFPLCSRVEVLTRSRQADDPGTRVVYEGGRNLRLESAEVERPGTSVHLHLRPEHRSLTAHRTLQELVTRDCDFIPYPIYLGSGYTVLNRLDAPWYHPERGEREIREGLMAIFGLDPLLAVLPLHEETDGGAVHGALHIAPHGVSPTLRLYSNRVLITEAGGDLLPESLRRFVSGVVDAQDLPLVLSRDAVLDGVPETAALRALIVHRLGQGLGELARRSRADYRALLAQHGRALKAACLAEELPLSELGDHFVFPSSLRAQVTLPEYLGGRPDRTVVYADDLSLGASLVPLYNRANVEVLYMTDPEDEGLRAALRSAGTGITFRRLDVDPPDLENEGSDDCGPAIARSTLEAVRLLFRSAAGERVRAELRLLGPEAPAALLAVSDQDRKLLGLVEGVRRFQREGRLDELPPKLRETASRRGFIDLLAGMTTETVILNTANDVIRILVRSLGSEGTPALHHQVLPEVARFLYGQALLGSGLYLSAERLTQISRSQTQLITHLLERLPDRG